MLVQDTEHARRSGEPPPPGAHFLNNVLATTASYVDEDPSRARDLLADLGAFLAYRLRDDLRPVPLADELDFVRTYLRLEEARYDERLHADVAADCPDGARVVPLAVQERVQEAVGRRLRDRPGAVRVALRVASDGGAVRVDLSDHPGGGEPERLVVDLEPVS